MLSQNDRPPANKQTTKDPRPTKLTDMTEVKEIDEGDDKAEEEVITTPAWSPGPLPQLLGVRTLKSFIFYFSHLS